LHEASGDLTEARTTLTEAWRVVTDAGIVAEQPVLAPDLVRLALAAGDREQAAAATEAIEALAARAPVAWVETAALRCRGAVEDAPATLLDAVAAGSDSPRPLELALAHEEAAGSLVRVGRAEEALAQLERALARYEQLEAWRRVAHAEAALRRLGVRRGGADSASGPPRDGTA
jgi:hypothetical protein